MVIVNAREIFTEENKQWVNNAKHLIILFVVIFLQMILKTNLKNTCNRIMSSGFTLLV